MLAATIHAAAKRSTCAACQRPPATCFCSWVHRVASTAALLILQHPLEATQTKGTARLLHACLPQSRLRVGEVFEPAQLAQLLGSAADGTPVRPILLYPPTPECAALGMVAPPKLNPAWLESPAQLQLVVLDASWRKSRKMLYLNPALQALPRLALNPVFLQPSRYAIRKAPQPGQLSSLEASCAALAQLENDAAKFTPILAAMDGFVAQQLRLAGR